jgi:hypothetical protein
MPKMSAEERADLESRLAADNDDDDDDEVEVGFADGSYVRGRYSRVKKAAHARGVKLEADPPPADGSQGAKPASSGASTPSGGDVRRFHGRSSRTA